MNITLSSQPFCRVTELWTYQGLAHGVEPTLATGNFAATRWIYQAQRGWLIEKHYQDDNQRPSNQPDDRLRRRGAFGSKLLRASVK